jgi:hypothetical protein
MNRLLLSLAGVLTTAMSAWAGNPSDLFSEKEMDFGTSSKGTVLIHYFRFTNTTAAGQCHRKQTAPASARG